MAVSTFVASIVLISFVLGLACVGSTPADVPGKTPEEALETYRSLLKARVLSAESQVLTPDSRRLLQRGYSGSQQSREASALADVADQARTIVEGDLAVIWFPASEEVSPYFLASGTGGWQIDLAGMARFIGFDRDNHWYFRARGHPYSFAFD